MDREQRRRDIIEIGKMDEDLHKAMEHFLLKNGWTNDANGRWQKKFGKKWRDVISVRVAFNAEINCDEVEAGQLT